MRFSINQDMVIRGINFTEDQDKNQLAVQLEAAPLFKNRLVAERIYRNRLDSLKLFTDGYTVLESKVVSVNTYLTLFEKAIIDAINSHYNSNGMNADVYFKHRAIFADGNAILDAVCHNSIHPLIMTKYQIKSPKYSKYLIQVFGEQSYVVKLFNDRPSKESIEDKRTDVIDGVKLVVSTLASNVMKMSSHNKFSSCQDYASGGYYTGDIGSYNIASLPSSVHDETMAIAYITNEHEDVMHPCMQERMLLLPFTYEEEPFLMACNYYHNSNDQYLESSLRSLYGNNIVFAHQNYFDNTNKIVFEHCYDYPLIIRVDNDGGRAPYSNHGNLSYYSDDYDRQVITVNKTYLDITIQDNGSRLLEAEEA